METINYDKASKKNKSNFMIYGLSTFMIVGVVIITYFLINEPTPRVIGSDPSKVAEQNASVNLDKQSKNQLESKVVTNNEKDTSSKHITADINFPKLYVGETEANKINQEIEENIRKTFVNLKENMNDNVKNTYEFTSLFRNYENMVGDKQIVSIIVTDKMVEMVSKNASYLNTTVYNVNLKTLEKENSYDVALELYGKNYKEYVSQKITTYLIDKKVKNVDEASYVYTGLENFYIESGEMHIVLNPSDIGKNDYGVLDIKISK